MHRSQLMSAFFADVWHRRLLASKASEEPSSIQSSPQQQHPPDQHPLMHQQEQQQHPLHSPPRMPRSGSTHAFPCASPCALYHGHAFTQIAASAATPDRNSYAAQQPPASYAAQQPPPQQQQQQQQKQQVAQELGVLGALTCIYTLV